MGWICAGVGLDECEVLVTREAQASLKLLLVTSTRGADPDPRAGSKRPARVVLSFPQ